MAGPVDIGSKLLHFREQAAEHQFQVVLIERMGPRPLPEGFAVSISIQPWTLNIKYQDPESQSQPTNTTQLDPICELEQKNARLQSPFRRK
jgi:hypothetical protein